MLCCKFFPSLLWWALFSKDIQPNPLQLPSFRVGKRRPVTDSAGEIVRLDFIKHKYLLRVWVRSTFMKWWVTFPYCRSRSMPHCEKLLPHMRLSLHSVTKGWELCGAALMRKTHHLCFHNRNISTAFQNTNHAVQFNLCLLMKQAFKLFLTNEYEVLSDLENKGKQMKCHILINM